MNVGVKASESSTAAAQRASGSSFYIGMRILPPHQRNAVFQIYSFCRDVDDIADDTGPRDLRLAALQQWRADVDALYAGTPPARLQGLSAPVREFALDRDDFLAVIDGMEMDVVSDIVAPDWATLDLYCDRVASAVGRLCVKVFGTNEKDGIELAHHLGRALQLTNILRDLDEDADAGRLYLPREALSQHDITAAEPAAVISHPRLGEVCTLVVERARQHFVQADRVMDRAPRRVVRTPRVMAEVYKLKLNGLVARGWSSPRRPIKIGRLPLFWILARYAVL
jgi:phytoene synthase